MSADSVVSPLVVLYQLTDFQTYAHAHTDQQVIHIAFPWQQWLRERPSMLRYTYLLPLVIIPCVVDFLPNILYVVRIT